VAAFAHCRAGEVIVLDLLLTFENGKQQSVCVRTPLTIGRARNSGLRIRSWRVASLHATLRGTGRALELEDLGSLCGTWVNGRRVAVHRPVLPEDDITIGPCRIRVRAIRDESFDDGRDSMTHGADDKRHATTHDASAGQKNPMPSQPRGADPVAGTGAVGTPAQAGEPQRDATDPRQPPAAATAALTSDGRTNACERSAGSRHHAFRERLHARLRDALDLRRRDVASMSDAALRETARTLLQGISAESEVCLTESEREDLCCEVLDEVLGLGPLETLLKDPNITEIMVNRYDEVYVERDGRLARHQTVFSSEQSVRWAIERIVAAVGRRIDESSPMVDARLADGSRVNAVIPPVALKGASLTIRKFPARRPQIADLIRQGSLSAIMAQFLMLCVQTRKNIVVSGGTGAGKTTLLNALAKGIPAGERIVTIEDAAELKLDHGNWVALESRPPNLENRGRIDIRDLVRNALRMRPDRIVVGECRGAEAFDMLTAMNTGHEGSLSTLHANSPRDALSRLESMVLMAGMDLPLSIVRQHIAASVDLIVQAVRLADGRRVVHSIAEVTGMESSHIQVQNLFRHTLAGGFSGAGLLPTFLDAWREAGVDFDPAAFSAAQALPRGQAGEAGNVA
jgi:pilus assembly protein CpaF